MNTLTIFAAITAPSLALLPVRGLGAGQHDLCRDLAERPHDQAALVLGTRELNDGVERTFHAFGDTHAR